MNAPRCSTKCRRCGARYDAHGRIGLACPDGSARAFQRHTPRPAVLWFGYPELTTLETVLRNALHAGGSAHELLALLGKVRSQRERVEREGAVAGEQVKRVELGTLQPAGAFQSFEEWVNKAQSWIGGTGAVCVDAQGRRCLVGRDFMRARDEDAFPVTFYLPKVDKVSLRRREAKAS